MHAHLPPTADAPIGGDWLIRQGELVLGPLAGSAVVARLYAGEATGATEISLVGRHDFRKIAELDVFKLHVAKAQAKLRVDVLERSVKEKARRARNTKLAIVAGVTVVVASGAASVARYLAVHNPWKNASTEPEITVEPPTIRLARAHRREDLLDYPLDRSGARRAPGGKTLAATARLPARAGQVPGEPDPDGMETARFDKGGIHALVSQKQRSLYPCFAEEARRSPGLNARIPIEFVIGNDGKVAKLWVDHPTYRDGSLQECLQREIQKWSFGAYEGERATVGLSFAVGKPG